MVSELQLLKAHEEIRDCSGDILQELQLAERQTLTLDALLAMAAGLLAFAVLARPAPPLSNAAARAVGCR